MKIVLIFFFSFAALSAGAQDYLITTRNDTVRGQCMVMSYDLLDRIQINDGKKKIQFGALQVKTAVIDNRVYHTVRTDNGYRLMQLVTPGFLSMYLARSPNSTVYQIEYLVKFDGSSLEVPNLGFKRTMISFLKDCHTIEDKIESGELGKKNMNALIAEYNRCLIAQTPVKTQIVPEANRDAIAAVNALVNKVTQSELTTRNDALDILKDITDKLNNGQRVPNYLQESLRSLLKDAPNMKAELDKMIEVLQVK